MTTANTFAALAANAHEHDAERRTWLLLTAAAGAVAAGGVALPLVASFSPSERALAMGAAASASDGWAAGPGALRGPRRAWRRPWPA